MTSLTFIFLIFKIEIMLCTSQVFNEGNRDDAWESVKPQDRPWRAPAAVCSIKSAWTGQLLLWGVIALMACKEIHILFCLWP